MSGNSVTPAALRVIRLALLGGVLLFGGVVWFVRGRGGPADMVALTTPLVTYVFVAICAGAAATIMALRSVSERTTDFGRRASLVIAAWAIGEGLAFLGGVHWFLTSMPTLFVLGFLVFVVGLATVPVPEPTAESHDR